MAANDTTKIVTLLHQERNQFDSQRAMAVALGIPQQTLSDILAGKTGLGLKTLTRVLCARPEWARFLYS